MRKTFRVIPTLTLYAPVKARRAFSPTKTWVFTHEMASNPTASPPLLSLPLPTSLNINLKKITYVPSNLFTFYLTGKLLFRAQEDSMAFLQQVHTGT